MSEQNTDYALLLGTRPHVFEERVLLPGTEGSYCFFCDGLESDPIHIDSSGAL